MSGRFFVLNESMKVWSWVLAFPAKFIINSSMKGGPILRAAAGLSALAFGASCASGPNVSPQSVSSFAQPKEEVEVPVWTREGLISIKIDSSDTLSTATATRVKVAQVE